MCLIDDRVNLGPCDLHCLDRILRLPCVHVACPLEPCGNIVPHGRINGKRLVYIVGWFNAIVLPPQLSYQGRLTSGPLTCRPSGHVAPLTSVRIDRVASCYVSAPCAPPAPRVGHPRLYHVSSVPRRIRAVVPRATSARAPVPLATSAPAISTPPFSDFLLTKVVKNSI